MWTCGFITRVIFATSYWMYIYDCTNWYFMMFIWFLPLLYEDMSYYICVSSICHTLIHLSFTTFYIRLILWSCNGQTWQDISALRLLQSISEWLVTTMAKTLNTMFPLIQKNMWSVVQQNFLLQIYFCNFEN